MNLNRSEFMFPITERLAAVHNGQSNFIDCENRDTFFSSELLFEYFLKSKANSFMPLYSNFFSANFAISAFRFFHPSQS